MRVLIDKHIPFLQGVLDGLAEVCFLEPEDFTRESVRNADTLIIRTRTRCNAALLDGSSVQFIATATIGTDHIDYEYCRARSIRVVSCPGCNAQAVCNYIEEALLETVISPSPDMSLLLSRYPLPVSIGIVGAGHVGKKVAKMAMSYGMHVVISDPPRHLNGDVTGCDIITFHTPLTHDGEYPTYHMCDHSFLKRCRPHALIINAARGGVVDEQALLDSNHPFILDTWEDEPHINPQVLDRAVLASYHIAGYSNTGKLNASRTCHRALCEHFGLPRRRIRRSLLPPPGDSEPGWLQRISGQLKARPQSFETLRKEYKLR